MCALQIYTHTHIHKDMFKNKNNWEIMKLQKIGIWRYLVNSFIECMCVLSKIYIIPTAHRGLWAFRVASQVNWSQALVR